MTDTADITAAFRDLGNFCHGIIPSRVSAHDYEPSRSDALAIINDLLIFARRVDRVLYAYGNYCKDNAMLPDRYLKDFSNVLLNTLEGNQTFLIESAIEQRLEDYADCMGDRG